MSAPSREYDLALIHELWYEYASAFVAGDIDRWISLWIRGGIELSAAGLLHSGTGQIRAASRPVMDLFYTQMANCLEYVRILGDRAYSYGSYRHVLTPKEGGESFSYNGRFLTILEKQASGSWKIAVACFNDGRKCPEDRRKLTRFSDQQDYLSRPGGYEIVCRRVERYE
jgi:ketosteroid isomerase-like protein